MICVNGYTSADQMGRNTLTPERKALLINLDKQVFGTFAEIGAAQEVVRHFFRVGGAANTIAKTMSAYDMTFSDEIYGKATRYVSRDRLNAMLSHEYKLLLERLSAKRGTTTKFFAFANTVATKGYKGNKESHGWLGIRFQSDPLEGPSDIILHVRMIDSDNLLQQEALGIVGVNLIYAAFYLSDDIDQMVTSLLDALSTARIEIDMLEVSGPKFSAVDNRLVSLKLLKLGLTAAVLLPPDGKVQQPSEVLYQRQLIVERGKFQPVTYLHVDMLDQARSYVKSLELSGSEPLLLCEITLNNLGSKEQLREEELLAHADELGALGYTVLVSEYPEFHKLISYFRRYTSREIFVVAGVDTIAKLFDDRYYANLEGGALEGLGRFFSASVALLLYPMLRERFLALLERVGLKYPPEDAVKLPDIIPMNAVQVQEKFKPLFQYLFQSGCVRDIPCGNSAYLSIDTAKVFEQMKAGDEQWTQAVPPAAAKAIKKHAAIYQTPAPEASQPLLSE